MKILVVQHNIETANLIGRGLGSLGHAATIASNAVTASEMCGQEQFDSILLDRDLPDGCGIALIATLRSIVGLQTPILVLSSRSTIDERIEGLMAGADDYLTQPFVMAELNARIAAVARRGALRANTGTATIGQLSLDVAGHCARFNDRSAGLNRREYSMLALLMNHAGRLVTREMLFNSVWNYTFTPSTNIVESNMSRLRARLAKIGCAPIETVRSRGYILRTERCVDDVTSGLARPPRLASSRSQAMASA